jgi:hypothetical protein
MRLALYIIAICYLANTLAIYETESGGLNVMFGNFGWHFAATGN